MMWTEYMSDGENFILFIQHINFQIIILSLHKHTTSVFCAIEGIESLVFHIIIIKKDFLLSQNSYNIV